LEDNLRVFLVLGHELDKDLLRCAVFDLQGLSCMILKELRLKCLIML
jgi:hypothetical protein